MTRQIMMTQHSVSILFKTEAPVIPHPNNPRPDRTANNQSSLRFNEVNIIECLQISLSWWIMRANMKLLTERGSTGCLLGPGYILPASSLLATCYFLFTNNFFSSPILNSNLASSSFLHSHNSSPHPLFNHRCSNETAVAI